MVYKELEHLLILVSAGYPGTNPSWIPRDNCIQLVTETILKIIVPHAIGKFYFPSFIFPSFIFAHTGINI